MIMAQITADEMIEKLKRDNPFRSADEAIVQFLRDNGLSRIDSIRVLSKIYGMRLGEAKELIHFSKAWQEERAATEKFWDELEKQLPEILDYKIDR
jgi:ribosomal protein L7/L12